MMAQTTKTLDEEWERVAWLSRNWLQPFIHFCFRRCFGFFSAQTHSFFFFVNRTAGVTSAATLEWLPRIAAQPWRHQRLRNTTAVVRRFCLTQKRSKKQQSGFEGLVLYNWKTKTGDGPKAGAWYIISSMSLHLKCYIPLGSYGAR